MSAPRGAAAAECGRGPACNDRLGKRRPGAWAGARRLTAAAAALGSLFLQASPATTAQTAAPAASLPGRAALMPQSAPQPAGSGRESLPQPSGAASFEPARPATSQPAAGAPAAAAQPPAQSSGAVPVAPARPAVAAPLTPAVPAMDAAVEDTYPVIGQMEQVTFGRSSPALTVEQRIENLESTIFKKNFPELSLFDRTQHLKDTLFGPSVNPDVAAPEPYGDPYAGADSFMPPGYGQLTGQQQQVPDDPLWQQPDYQVERPRAELERFALELVNSQREQMGYSPLEWDEIAERVCDEHVDELCRNNNVSHLSHSGANPDQRYTEAGGNNAMTESLVSYELKDRFKRNRAAVARLLRIMESRQDDRDALLSPDATHFAFGFGQSKDQTRVLGCAETVTKHSIMHPIPTAVKVGEKVELKGVVLEPYRFHKITIAWEGVNPDLAGALPATTEAMPYFPPLDYIAYARKSEKDWSKAKTALVAVGVLAAIAGGMVIPPVALAAPVIAMAGTSGEIKPAPDVPVKGGVKVSGRLFSTHLPLDNDGKPGLYYVTVWAYRDGGARSVPVSRRVLVVRDRDEGNVKKLEAKGAADGSEPGGAGNETAVVGAAEPDS